MQAADRADTTEREQAPPATIGHIRPRPGQRVAVGIWPLLKWAFQAECAQLDFAEAESEAGGSRGFGMEFVMMEQARLGCRVDGGGRSTPHPDADVVASALANIGPESGGPRAAVWVAELARVGKVPDWMPNAVPRLYPTDTHTNRFGTTAKTADAATLGSEGWPATKRRNKRGNPVTEAVLYCPAVWRPTARQVASARRAYLDWWGVLLDLRVSLRSGLALSAFEVSDDMPPITPWRGHG